MIGGYLTEVKLRRNLENFWCNFWGSEIDAYVGKRLGGIGVTTEMKLGWNWMVS